jgi:predicted choloylglycine hydrolase
MMASLRFRAIDEPQLSRNVHAVFTRRWPVYRAWFLRDGDAARPDGRTCRLMIGHHMPELLPIYDRLLTCLGADQEQARFLSLWCPPNFMHGCTQAIWRRQPYGLIRNYDYMPGLCDALLLRSGWLGSPVLAMSDCVWGALDGMNASGLAVSLSFGGRRVEGPGFGVTLVLRYILETCRNAAEGLAVLRRVPVHLSYNIALADREGGWCSVAIAPGRTPEVRCEPYSANRQGEHSWPDEESLSDTVRREVILASCLDNPQQTEAGLIQQFMRRPLYRPVSEVGWGTLYTAAYRPAEGVMDLCWPQQRWRQSLAAFAEGERVVEYP